MIILLSLSLIHTTRFTALIQIGQDNGNYESMISHRQYDYAFQRSFCVDMHCVQFIME